MEDARQLARRLLEALENPPTAAISSQSLVPRPGEASQQSGVLSLGKYVIVYIIQSVCKFQLIQVY